MQTINTKKILPQRIAIRDALATRIKKNNQLSKTITMSPKLKESLKQRARTVAKAFRNSQKKYGVHEAEVRLSLSQAIKARKTKLRAARQTK